MNEEEKSKIEIVRGMTRDLPSFFFDRPKINYSKGLSEVVICSAISTERALFNLTIGVLTLYESSYLFSQ
jgi:hypothetical protein